MSDTDIDKDIDEVQELFRQGLELEDEGHILDEALSSANDMIERSQSENTKNLYRGSCLRFFDWANKQSDAGRIA